MKIKQTYIYTVIVLIIIVSGCTKEFLNKTPLDSQTEETAFKTDENFRTYSWSLYSILYRNYSPTDSYQDENRSDDMYDWSRGINSWAMGDMIVPASSGSWVSDFAYIRKVNLMLDNIENSELNETKKNHWRSVGYFFRAYKYFQMVRKYGDVQWIEHVLSDIDEEVYKPRDPRNTVTAKILENLEFALANIEDASVIENNINKDVIRGFISRFGLFEGTWRKYHGLGEEDIYLQACVTASEVLLQNHPTLHDHYDELWNLEDLIGLDGILLCRSYVKDKVTQGATRGARSSANRSEHTKDMINSYLCSNGRTIEANGRMTNEPNPYIEFRDRDYRLYFSSCPPYRIEVVDKKGWQEIGVVDGVDHSEYIRLLEQISGDGFKKLPIQNYNGFVKQGEPSFLKNKNGYGFCSSQAGYYTWKFYNETIDALTYSSGTNDMPIFRMGEILINYAEAMKELGLFDQTVADATINKLRARAHIADMAVGDIDGNFDVNRDPDVDPVMWEIRRERRIELFGEGFRFHDLRRWKKGSYIIKIKVGAYIEDKEEVKPYRILLDKVAIEGGGSTGFAETSSVKPQSSWPEYYYLYPIPTDQLLLNENLTQNPGWEPPAVK